MSKALDPLIKQVLRKHLQGIGIEVLEHELSQYASRRTINRRLDEMIQQGVVECFGKARATKYAIVFQQAKETWVEDDSWKNFYANRRSQSTSILCESDPLLDPSAEESVISQPSGVKFSTESKKLNDELRSHYSLRQPVWYKRDFLANYIPNQTAYLSEELRRHLTKIGQSEVMAELPPGTYARHVLDRLIIDLTWNSSRLEGSTYSMLETDYLLALGHAGDAERYQEAQMIINHKAAIEFLVEGTEEMGFNRYTFLNLHAILTEGLLKNSKSEGKLREIAVGISGTVFHPLNNPLVIEECFDMILAKAGAIRDPLECCFFLMVHLPYLQPFEDGNKRTSRLAANLPLIRNNMSPLSFVGMPLRDYTNGIISVYEFNRFEVLRDVFVYAYEKSAERYSNIRDEIGEPDPLLLAYRLDIRDCVHDIVVQKLDKLEAAHHLRLWTRKNVTAKDQERFMQVVEERLLSLTEGNIARARIRPSEYHAWASRWHSGRVSRR